MSWLTSNIRPSDDLQQNIEVRLSNVNVLSAMRGGFENNALSAMISFVLIAGIQRATRKPTKRQICGRQEKWTSLLFGTPLRWRWQPENRCDSRDKAFVLFSHAAI
jgi:hypothetical protein